jgi:hypothetical protein
MLQCAINASNIKVTLIMRLELLPHEANLLFFGSQAGVVDGSLLMMMVNCGE